MKTLIEENSFEAWIYGAFILGLSSAIYQLILSIVSLCQAGGGSWTNDES